MLLLKSTRFQNFNNLCLSQQLIITLFQMYPIFVTSVVITQSTLVFCYYPFGDLMGLGIKFDTFCQKGL